ncbi:hypothetical protein CMQ_1866 [Grosmannia clavigera kw1407]|uniref:Uncharacterized protein n=1 Tax=Grosmannia clavigera (strain kw1407 / UAMH 11150) TaxID=655863 RepID=F0XMX3_GROCL|nr:uncharacterized protein CMQ_1866 [Grosmannia clavigera kw1407]EFX00785.1 hypothetical protein CMQ_1866 [Grosmannia clavigera kw1407]
MTSPAETAQSVREALEPFIRPRGEAAQIRRILAAHLASCLKSDSALEGSLALVNVSCDVEPSAEARGLQRAYLRALQANLEARRAFETTSQAATRQQQQYQKQKQQQPTDGGAVLRLGGAEGVGTSVLENHLEEVRLTRKKERLEAVQRSLDALVQQPAAAAEDFLQQEAIYAEATRTLPPVPKAVVDGLAEDATAAAEAAVQTAGPAGAAAGPAATVTDLKGLVAQLERAVLRAQLLLRQEEKQLAAARARAAARGPESAAVKLQALGAARDALIGWMEEELGNAATAGEGGHNDQDDEDHEGDESLRQLRQSLLGNGGDSYQNSPRQQIEAEVAVVREKYARYVEARRQLVQMVGSKASPVAPLFANMPKLQPWAAELIRPVTTRQTAAAADAPQTTSGPTATTTPTVDPAATASRVALGHVLLTPYLERLLAVARQQKALIAHKAHHHNLLARRIRDTCQTLNHVADESQLLPRHPQPGGPGPSKAGGQLTRHVTAWTYAADAAKLATFESVAEQLESGEDALEQAARTLDEVELLLGHKRTEDGGDGAVGDEDEKGATKAKRQATTNDVWETLDGELGLIRTEKSSR